MALLVEAGVGRREGKGRRHGPAEEDELERIEIGEFEDH